MPEALQISNAAAPPAKGTGDPAKPTLRDALMSAWDKVFQPTGSPLETEYNPLQAANIGAGAASMSGINQLKQLFQSGSGALAQAGGMPEEAARMRELAAQTGQQNQDAGALYEPMQQAYPYATAIGEATPAMVPGGMAAFRTQAGLNMGRNFLDEMAQAIKSEKLMALAKGLRRY